MRAVRLRALGDRRRRERNPNRTRHVAEHGKQRRRVGVKPPRDRDKGDGGQRHKQEPQPYRLRAAEQHQRFEVDIRRQRAGPEERHRQAGKAEGDDPARLHHRHQLQHQRNGQHNQHRAGREHQPGPGGGIAQILLRQLRNNHRTAVQDHRHPRHQQAGDRKVAVLHTVQIHHRLSGIHQPVDRADNADQRQYCEGADKVRIEPVIIFAPVEHHLQTAKTEGDQADPRPVDGELLFRLFLPRRIFQQLIDGQHRHNPYRDIDKEHPAPGVVIGDPAPQRGTEYRRDDNGNG